MTSKVDCEKLKLKADQLEDITKNYVKDKQQTAKEITDCKVKADQLAIKCEEILRQGNRDLKKDTETKMCHFTENLILEMKYLNKRLEDKILFQVGFYKEEQDDERSPPPLPNLKITSKDLIA